MTFANILSLLIVASIPVTIVGSIGHKAGYSFWLCGLGILVPGLNIIIALVLAFAEWPIQKRLRLAESNNPQQLIADEIAHDHRTLPGFKINTDYPGAYGGPLVKDPDQWSK